LAAGGATGPFEAIVGVYKGVDAGNAVVTGPEGLPGRGAADDVVAFGFREGFEGLLWATAGGLADTDAVC